MKTTDAFKNTIQAELYRMADKDPLFAESLKKPNKSIDDCITYILNEVQKSGCNGFADDEIFGMAAHYYDEDDIEPGKPIKMKVVVNRTHELSKSEIDQAKKEAKEKLIAEEMERLRTRRTTIEPKKLPEQLSLI